MTKTKDQINEIIENVDSLCKEFKPLADDLCDFAKENRDLDKLKISWAENEFVKSWVGIENTKRGFEELLEDLE